MDTGLKQPVYTGKTGGGGWGRGGGSGVPWGVGAAATVRGGARSTFPCGRDALTPTRGSSARARRGETGTPTRESVTAERLSCNTPAREGETGCRMREPSAGIMDQDY